MINSKKIKLMVMAATFTWMAQNTRATGTIIYKKAMEMNNGVTAAITKVDINKEWNMHKVIISGAMEVNMKDNGFLYPPAILTIFCKSARKASEL